MPELLLIRHAETDFNRQLRFQGHLDAPLNAVGREQAERLAQRLADEPIDLLVASDLQRARQTAAPLAARRRLPVLPDARWREQAFGVLEGLDVATIRAQHPELWARWTRHDPDDAPPGGESRRAFYERVWAALRALAQAHAGARVAVVTHGGVLDMVWRGVQGGALAGPRTCHIPNTGLNRLRPGGAASPPATAGAAQVAVMGRAVAPGFVIVQWADAAHLDGMAAPPVHYPAVVAPAAGAAGAAAVTAQTPAR